MSNFMTRQNKEIEFRELISPLYLLMQLSIKAYQKYLANKIYLHALVIRSANRKIYDHLLKNLHLVPDELQDEVLRLMNHYDIWMHQFEDFESRRKPGIEDEFVFYHIDEQSAFPRDAEKKIFDYYLQLKNLPNE